MEPPRVFYFKDMLGHWRVTVSNRGGKAPRFDTESDARAHAEATAEKLGLGRPTKL